jgi:diadenylate cyclase
VEPSGFSFYTVAVSFDTLTSLFDRFGSESYPVYVVLAELLLIGLVVNWCAGVLHGTRGTRLLRGLLIVLIAATLIVRVLADQLGLTRLDLLYNYFIIGMAFVALVAFQPELRRALIRAGELPFRRPRLPQSKLISPLVESAGYLSRNRYGALIAIQRDVGLANWAEHGTQLNAEVSANLLNSVFYPNSALHDLGVIIRGNRVLAAGCQFPVAESGELDTSLGSRHRAAVGLSAESDALVLVVSEETGTISLADSGKLTRFLALDDLREELEARLAGGYLTSSKRRRVHTLSDVWRLVRRLLVVVPLTLVIWFLADQASLVRAEGIKLELNITHDDTLHVDVAEPPLFVLNLRGSKREIDALQTVATERPIKLDWPLPPAYARPGHMRLEKDELREIIANLPALHKAGVFVEDVSPGRFEFAVDEVASVMASVRVDAGTLRVSVEHVEPERVTVWLRRADLKQLSEDQLFINANLEERLAGKPRNDRLSFEGVPLEMRIGGFEVLRVEPRTVNLEVRVVAETIRRRLAGISVDLAASPQIWQRYDIDRADANEWLLELEVEGDESVVNALRPQDVRAIVPLTGEQAVPTADYRLMDVVIELPAGVRLVRPAPQVRFRLVPREGATP